MRLRYALLMRMVCSVTVCVCGSRSGPGQTQGHSRPMAKKEWLRATPDFGRCLCCRSSEQKAKRLTDVEGPKKKSSARVMGLIVTWPTSLKITLLPIIASVMHNSMRLTAILICPNCGHRSTETMSTDACQFFYECRGCGMLLKPLEGDCCVFCSYGDVSCPPVQQGMTCCEEPRAKIR